VSEMSVYRNTNRWDCTAWNRTYLIQALAFLLFVTRQ